MKTAKEMYEQIRPLDMGQPASQLAGQTTTKTTKDQRQTKLINELLPKTTWTRIVLVLALIGQLVRILELVILQPSNYIPSVLLSVLGMLLCAFSLAEIAQLRGFAADQVAKETDNHDRH